MSDKLVTIKKYNDYVQAEFDKQTLENFGIKAVVTGENTANLYSGLDAVADIRLMTLEKDVVKANEILKSQQQKED